MDESLGWISIIVIGGLAGWLASLVAKRNERMGCLLNIAVGVVGAVIGGWLFRSLDLDAPGGRYFSSLVVAFVGATIFLLVLKLFTRGSGG